MKGSHILWFSALLILVLSLFRTDGPLKELYFSDPVEPAALLESVPVPTQPPIASVDLPPDIDSERVTDGSPLLPDFVVFATNGSHEVAWESNTPAAVRAWSVNPDMTLFRKVPVIKVGDRLELSLFDDVTLEASIKNVTVYPSGAVGMTARMEGRFRGVLYLTYSGNEIRVSADVLEGNDYYVRFDPETGRHIAIEVDRQASDYLECETCKIADPALVLPGDVLAVANEPEQVAAESTDVTIDVMVVYTPAAKAAEGGLSGINNNIAMAMQKSNQVLGNSDTKVVFNLVHAAETDYVESGDATTDLWTLTLVGGSYAAMDEIHDLRDIYGADLVCLVESIVTVGGVGWLLNSTAGMPYFGFCLAGVAYSDWTYVVIHEWGHNMGCGHSKTQTAGPGPGLFYYSAGWQWSDSASPASIGYCSVMTYENFDSSGRVEYKEVPYFSNPDITYTGSSTNPTGDPVHGDNARTIREMRYVLAGYRTGIGAVSDYPSTNSFETIWLPWNAYSGQVFWMATEGATPTSSTGPSAAYDGVNYIYLEASGNGGKTGILEARFDFTSLAKPEISYAYHMYGSNMGSLYLEVSTNGGAEWIPVWSLSGNQGTSWNNGVVSLRGYGGEPDVRLRFRGVVGGTRSDMALDKITVREEEDIDGDELPDYWEYLYFLNPTGAVATADSDGDGSDNLTECVAGTVPIDPDSVFKITTFEPPAFGSTAPFIVNWIPVEGRVYNVLLTDNLYIPFVSISGDLPYPANSYTDQVERTAPQLFYRVDVRAPE